MKRANDSSAAANFFKYALLVLAILPAVMLSCANGISSEKEPERIRYFKEHFEGWIWVFAGGTYIDNNGRIYSVTPQIIQSSLASNGYSENIASLILSKGTVSSITIPRDSLVVMDSLLDEVHKNTDSTSHLLIDYRGGCQWGAFDPVPYNSPDTAIVLKVKSALEYSLMSEQAVRLTKMIEKYCGD